MAKIITPDWVSKTEKRKRFFGVLLGGVLVGVSVYFGIAIFLNLFTETVELALWRSLAGLTGCGFGLWFAWGIVPKKSVWLAELEKSRK